MPRGSTQKQNHPPVGAAIKVEPIRDLEAIRAIKQSLSEAGKWRDYCLFTLGINTAYRASELLSLTVGQVARLKPGDRLEVREKKTKKYRAATLNGVAVEALGAWLAVHPRGDDPHAPLFISRRSDRPLGVSSVNRLVKGWCAAAGLAGNYGSHTLRKSWGYHQRVGGRTPLPLLMTAFGHTSQRQTLDYLGIQEPELGELFTDLEL